MSAPQKKQEVIISSFLIAAIISFLIALIPHFSAENTLKIMPKSNVSSSQSFNSPFNTYTYSSEVEWASFKCGFGNFHSIETKGKTVGDFMNNDLSFDQILKSTFDHLGLLAIISVVLTTIISILRLLENDQQKFKEIK